MSPNLRANLRPTPYRLVPCRAGTKQARAVDLLARPEGATPEDLLEACSPWSWETVKSFLYHDINSVKGYGIRSEMIGGVTRLFLVYPEGVEAPLPHTPRLPVPKPTAHQLEVARHIEEYTGRSVAEMKQREILEHCRRLGLKTASGKDHCMTAASNIQQRVRSFLKSN